MLEVVLALLLFVAAVAVVSSALNSSIASVDRQRFSLHAANLAATVHAELDLGLRSADSMGPEPFTAPFEEWSWQLMTAAQESASGSPSGLTSIEVVIRNTNSAAVFRLAQMHRAVKSVTLTNAPSGKDAL